MRSIDCKVTTTILPSFLQKYLVILCRLKLSVLVIVLCLFSSYYWFAEYKFLIVRGGMARMRHSEALALLTARNAELRQLKKQHLKGVRIYENVTRSKVGNLYMAFYFPQYHIAPENKMQLKVKEDHYTDWDVLAMNPDRSLTPKLYYNLADARVLDNQDELAHKYGVGVFIFYHYWLDNSMVLSLPLDHFINKPRRTKFLLCWDNESGFLGQQLYDSPKKHAYALLRYFLSENYLTDIYGRKPFIVYQTSHVDVVYLAEFITHLETYGVRIKLGHNYQEHKNKWALPEWSSVASEFGPHLEGGAKRRDLYTYKRRDPSWSSGLEYWQGATTSWDSRPRCNSVRTHQRKCGGKTSNGQVSVEGFRLLLRELTSSFHSLNVDRIVTIFAWNEWAEGAALEESVEYGLGFIEQLV